MNEYYQVRVAKDDLVFSAAHFITYNGDQCERLHGHNYHVAVDVWGTLDENQYLIDFVALRNKLRTLVAPLDHRVLLPTQHQQIAVAAGEGEVQVTFGDRRWVFPREDCVLLPVANTTTELLARHLGQALLTWLQSSEAGSPQVARLAVSVDENEGQWGSWHYACDANSAASASSTSSKSSGSS